MGRFAPLLFLLKLIVRLVKLEEKVYPMFQEQLIVLKDIIARQEASKVSNVLMELIKMKQERQLARLVLLEKYVTI
jgi:hypothetical protein